jgi:hypothetical protein
VLQCVPLSREHFLSIVAELNLTNLNMRWSFLAPYRDACWHHSGAWASLQIDGTTAWDAMATWYKALPAGDGDGDRASNGAAATARRYWKEAAPGGFPCKECCPATHPPVRADLT